MQDIPSSCATLVIHNIKIRCILLTTFYLPSCMHTHIFHQATRMQVTTHNDPPFHRACEAWSDRSCQPHSKHDEPDLPCRNPSSALRKHAGKSFQTRDGRKASHNSPAIREADKTGGYFSVLFLTLTYTSIECVQHGMSSSVSYTACSMGWTTSAKLQTVTTQSTLVQPTVRQSTERTTKVLQLLPAVHIIL